MNKKNISFLVQSILAVYLAVSVWVWLRYAVLYWLSDSMGFMTELFKSVDPLKASLVAFLILVAPALFVNLLIHRSLPSGIRLIFYAFLGSLFSTFYLLIMTKFNLAYIDRRALLFFAAGGVAGLTYCTILDFPWRSRPALGNNTDVLQGRRMLLGSLGVFAGTASFLGALAGPFYIWKNRNRYIDVNVGLLEEGQLMTVEVANKPVWIVKRSPDVIRLLEQENLQLLDPLSRLSYQPEEAQNRLRSIRPEYFVAYGICTHLGCSPSYRPYGLSSDDTYPSSAPQFFCPCHGGVFDLAGRVYKGTPPPVNMVVPHHEFVSDGVVRIYFPSLADEWNA